MCCKTEKRDPDENPRTLGKSEPTTPWTTFGRDAEAAATSTIVDNLARAIASDASRDETSREDSLAGGNEAAQPGARVSRLRPLPPWRLIAPPCRERRVCRTYTVQTPTTSSQETSPTSPGRTTADQQPSAAGSQ